MKNWKADRNKNMIALTKLHHDTNLSKQKFYDLILFIYLLRSH